MASVMATIARARLSNDLTVRANAVKEVRDYLNKYNSYLSDADKALLNSQIQAINPLPNQAGDLINKGAQAVQAANDAAIAKQLDDEEMAKFVPLKQQILDIFQKRWDKIAEGSTTDSPLDDIKMKYDSAKQNNWPKSKSAYARIYNTLSLVYNNAAEAAKARQEMG